MTDIQESGPVHPTNHRRFHLDPPLLTLVVFIGLNFVEWVFLLIGKYSDPAYLGWGALMFGIMLAWAAFASWWHFKREDLLWGLLYIVLILAALGYLGLLF